MKLSPSEKRTLSLVGTALVLLLGWSLVISPWLSNKRGSGNQTFQQQITEAKLLMSQAGRIRSRHNELAKAVKAEEGRFLPDATPDSGRISLLALVQKAAAEAGLTLETLAPVTADIPPPRIAVEVSGTGSAGAVGAFLQGLTRNKIRMSVARLSLTAVEGGRLSLRVVIATWLPNAEK